MNLIRIILIGYGLYNIAQGAVSQVRANLDWEFGEFNWKRDVQILKEKIKFSLYVTNKNEFEIPIHSIQLSAKQGGEILTLIKVIDGVTIPAKPADAPFSKTRYDFTSNILSENVLKHIGELLTGADSLLDPIKINGNISGTIKEKTLTLPISTEIKPEV